MNVNGSRKKEIIPLRQDNGDEGSFENAMLAGESEGGRLSESLSVAGGS